MKPENAKNARRNALYLAVCAALAFAAPGAFAKGDEDNLERLGSFKRTDTQPGQSVPQGGKYAREPEEGAAADQAAATASGSSCSRSCPTRGRWR